MTGVSATACLTENALKDITSPVNLNSGNLEDVYKLQVTDFDEPQTLEVFYSDGRGGTMREIIFVDPIYADNRPRICVAVGAIQAMHTTISVLSRKVDNLVTTLNACRSAYFKEISGLRELVRQKDISEGRFKELQNTVIHFDPTAFDSKTLEEIDKKVRDATSEIETKLLNALADNQRLNKRLLLLDKEMQLSDKSKDTRERIADLLQTMNSDTLLRTISKIAGPDFQVSVENFVSETRGLDVSTLLSTLQEEKDRADSLDADLKKAKDMLSIQLKEILTAQAETDDLQNKLKESNDETEQLKKQMQELKKIRDYTNARSAEMEKEKLYRKENKENKDTSEQKQQIAALLQQVSELTHALDKERSQKEKPSLMRTNTGLSKAKSRNPTRTETATEGFSITSAEASLEQIDSMIKSLKSDEEKLKLALDVITELPASAQVAFTGSFLKAAKAPEVHSAAFEEVVAQPPTNLASTEPTTPPLSRLLSTMDLESLTIGLQSIPFAAKKHIFSEVVNLFEASTAAGSKRKANGSNEADSFDPIADLSKNGRRALLSKIIKGLPGPEIQALADLLGKNSKRAFLTGIFEDEDPDVMGSCAQLLVGESSLKAFAKNLGEKQAGYVLTQIVQRLDKIKVLSLLGDLNLSKQLLAGPARPTVSTAVSSVQTEMSGVSKMLVSVQRSNWLFSTLTEAKQNMSLGVEVSESHQAEGLAEVDALLAQFDTRLPQRSSRVDSSASLGLCNAKQSSFVDEGSDDSRSASIIKLVPDPKEDLPAPSKEQVPEVTSLQFLQSLSEQIDLSDVDLPKTARIFLSEAVDNLDLDTQLRSIVCNAVSAICVLTGATAEQDEDLDDDAREGQSSLQGMVSSTTSPFLKALSSAMAQERQKSKTEKPKTKLGQGQRATKTQVVGKAQTSRPSFKEKDVPASTRVGSTEKEVLAPSMESQMEYASMFTGQESSLEDSKQLLADEIQQVAGQEPAVTLDNSFAGDDKEEEEEEEVESEELAADEPELIFRFAQQLAGVANLKIFADGLGAEQVAMLFSHLVQKVNLSEEASLKAFGDGLGAKQVDTLFSHLAKRASLSEEANLKAFGDGLGSEQVSMLFSHLAKRASLSEESSLKAFGDGLGAKQVDTLFSHLAKRASLSEEANLEAFGDGLGSEQVATLFSHLFKRANLIEEANLKAFGDCLGAEQAATLFSHLSKRVHPSQVAATEEHTPSRHPSLTLPAEVQTDLFDVSKMFVSLKRAQWLWEALVQARQHEASEEGLAELDFMLAQFDGWSESKSGKPGTAPISSEAFNLPSFNHLSSHSALLPEDVERILTEVVSKLDPNSPLRTFLEDAVSKLLGGAKAHKDEDEEEIKKKTLHFVCEDLKSLVHLGPHHDAASPHPHQVLPQNFRNRPVTAPHDVTAILLAQGPSEDVQPLHDALISVSSQRKLVEKEMLQETLQVSAHSPGSLISAFEALRQRNAQAQEFLQQRASKGSLTARRPSVQRVTDANFSPYGTVEDGFPDRRRRRASSSDDEAFVFGGHFPLQDPKFGLTNQKAQTARSAYRLKDFSFNQAESGYHPRRIRTAVSRRQRGRLVPLQPKLQQRDGMSPRDRLEGKQLMAGLSRAPLAQLTAAELEEMLDEMQLRQKHLELLLDRLGFEHQNHSDFGAKGFVERLKLRETQERLQAELELLQARQEDIRIQLKIEGYELQWKATANTKASTLSDLLGDVSTVLQSTDQEPSQFLQSEGDENGEQEFQEDARPSTVHSELSRERQPVLNQESPKPQLVSLPLPLPQIENNQAKVFRPQKMESGNERVLTAISQNAVTGITKSTTDRQPREGRISAEAAAVLVNRIKTLLVRKFGSTDAALVNFRKLHAAKLKSSQLEKDEDQPPSPAETSFSMETMQSCLMEAGLSPADAMIFLQAVMVKKSKELSGSINDTEPTFQDLALALMPGSLPQNSLDWARRSLLLPPGNASRTINLGSMRGLSNRDARTILAKH